MLKKRLNLRNLVKTVACLAESKVMSSGNYSRKVWFCLLSAGIMLSFASCSSPEKDGIKAAKMAYNYRKDYDKKRIEITKEQNKAYETYIEKFHSFSFVTRVDAREKLTEYLEKSKISFQKLEEDAREWERNAQEYRNKLRSKYETNREKQEKFNYAYNNYRPKKSSSNTPQEVYIDYHSRIRDLIITIIPPKPDVERLKNDINGRAIVNQTAGYSNWTINSLEDLKGLELLNTTDNGKEIQFDTKLNLQRINQWDAKINVRYVLPDNEDWWKLETFNSQMNIVRTGKYDKCLNARKTAKTGYKDILELTNNCDVSIVVAGETQSTRGIGQTSDSPWREFQILVNPNSKREYDVKSDSWLGGLNKYVIHFIEQGGL